MPQISVTLKGYDNGNDLKLVYPEGITEHQIASEIQANAPDLPADSIKFDFIPSERDVQRQDLQLQRSQLEANPIQEGMEPGGTIKKSAYAFTGGVAKSEAWALEGLAAGVEAMINKPREWMERAVYGKERFEKLKKESPEWSTGVTRILSNRIGQGLRRKAEDFNTVAQATKGSDALANLAETAATSVPVAGAGMVAGLPGAYAISGLISRGSAKDQAKEYLGKLGVDEREAEDISDQVGNVAGAITAAVTKYVPAVGSKIPGIGKYMGEGVEGITKKVLIDRLKEGPRAALIKDIAANAFGEATEESIDQTAQAVIEKLTSRQGMTLGQAIQEISTAGGAGFILGGGMRAPFAASEAYGPQPTVDPEKPDLNIQNLPRHEGQFDTGYGNVQPGWREGLTQRFPAKPPIEPRPPIGRVPGRSDAKDQIPTVEIQPTAEPASPVAPVADVPPKPEIIQAAAEAAPEPTDAQKEAGNYRKGHLRLDGMDLSIENPKGSVRSGKDSDGETWQVTMPVHYGYIKGTKGKDNDHLDISLPDNPDAGEVVAVIDQINLDTGKFDEHKTFYGFETEESALQAYRDSFSDGRADDRIGAVSIMTKPEFKAWADSGKTSAPLKFGKETPNVQPADTRGQGVQYHGSRQPIASLDEGHYSSLNYYGQGFYTTDSTDIARGYSGQKKGNTRGKVYQISKKKDAKLYDMEQPIDDSVTRMIKGLDNELLDQALAENPKTLREFYDEVRDSSREFGYSTDSVQELFDSIAENLEQQGYDGLRHVGGLRTGNAPHNVEIYFKPWEILELSEPTSNTLPTEPQATAETAVEPIAAPTERGGATPQSVGTTPGNQAETLQSAPAISEAAHGNIVQEKPETPPEKPAAASYSQSITATGIEGIRQAVDQSDLPTYSKAVVRAMLDTPAMRDLAWDKLTLNLVPDTEDGFQGSADLRGMLIEMSRQASPDTFAHEVFHFMHELVPDSYRLQIEKLRKKEIERVLSRTTDPARRALLNQLLGGTVSSMEWSRMGYDPDLYNLRSGSEFMATLFGKRFSDETFFRRGESPIKSIVRKIQAWVNGLLDAIKRVIGVDPSIDRIYRELLAGTHKLTPEAGARFDEIHGSLAPVATPDDYRVATDFDPLMDPADAEFERRAYWLENAASVWPVSEKVGQMEAKVAREIPELVDRVKTLVQSGNEVGWGTLPQTADLQSMVEQMAGQPHDQARLAFGALANIANLYDVKNGLAERIKNTEEKLKIASNRDAEQQKRDIATTIVERIVNSERKVLLEQRDKARQAGLADQVNQINAKLEWNFDRQEAMRRTVMAIAKHLKIKPEALADNGVVDLWQQFKAQNDPEIYITPDVVSEVERMLRQINQYIPASQVKALEDKLNNQRQALEFLEKEVLQDPQVLKNFDYAAKAAGESRATILRQQQGSGKHDIIYTNPFNKNERVSVRPGFDSKTYEDNLLALTTAAQWFREFISDPTADPLQREAHKHELYQIENVHLNQHYNPAVGKLVVGDASALVDPWTFAIRITQGLMDIPEYALNMVGGRHGKEAFAALTNYSNFMEKIKDIQAHNQRELQVLSIAAAKKHGLAKGSWDVNGVIKWQRDIADQILGSYQNRGDVRYKTGMKVRGYKITKEDMAAVRSQKQYIDQIVKAMETLEQGTEFMKRDPVRIRDVVGRVVIDRRGLDTSGWTVPQRLRGIAMRFCDEWTRIRAQLRHDLNNAPDQDARGEIEKQAVVKYARLMSDEKYWDAVLSHVESYSNPAYAADNPTTFKKEYQAIAFERMESGSAPTSFDMLVKTIFEMQRTNGVDEQASETEIARQVIKEIGRTVRAFLDNESNSTPLVDTRPDINIIHAENWANRPRGKRILPRGFYEYAISTSDDINNVSRAYVEVLAQRYINKLVEMRDTLESDLRDFRELVSLGIKTEQDIRQDQIDGKHFLNLRELEVMVPMVNRQVSAMQQWANHMQELERDSYSSINIYRGGIVNSLLQKADTLVRNAFGPGARWHQLDRMMLSSGRSVFLNNPIVGVGVTTIANMRNMGRTVVSGLSRMLASPILNTETGQTVLAQLKKSPDYWANIATYWLHQIQLRNSEIARDKELGIVNPDPWKEAILSYAQMSSTGGRLQKDGKTRWAQSVIGMATETGSLMMLPRALGANAVDRAVNAQAGWYAESVIKPLQRAAMSYEERASMGYDPTKTILTPEEVFGSKKGDAESLAFMREVFDNAGINLDRTLIEFWQKASEAKNRSEPVEEIPLLTETQLNSLRMEIAKKINKPTFANRPIYKNKVQSFMMTFLGYPIWQNAEISKWHASFSRGNKSKARQNLRSMMVTSEVMFSHILNGLISGSIGAFLGWLLYRERKYAKKWAVAAAGGAGDLIETAMEKSAAQLPLIGNLINYGVFKTVGAGGRFAYGGFSLLPISFAESLMSTVARTITTKDMARPWIEWVRAWFPQSRIVANRLPITEGITRQREGRAIIASNRPPGVELKPFSGNVKYSPFSDEYDEVANLLYRPGAPDWPAINQIRSQVAQDKLADKRRQGDAYSIDKALRDFDSAIISGRSPYTVLSREMTQHERNKFLNNLETSELETVRDLENRLKAYARHYNRAEPDFIRQNMDKRSDYRRSEVKLMGAR